MYHFTFLQISLMSDLTVDSWVIRSAFRSLWCNLLFLLKYVKKIQPHKDMWLEKEELVYPKKVPREAPGILWPQFENHSPSLGMPIQSPLGRRPEFRDGWLGEGCEQFHYCEVRTFSDYALIVANKVILYRKTRKWFKVNLGKCLPLVGDTEGGRGTPSLRVLWGFKAFGNVLFLGLDIGCVVFYFLCMVKICYNRITNALQITHNTENSLHTHMCIKYECSLTC